MMSTLRNRLSVSLAAGPDELALFETLMMSASEISSAGNTAMTVYRMRERVPRDVLMSARAAAMRAIAAIDRYNAERNEG